MRHVPLALLLALALPASARAQDNTAHPIPLGMMGMRLGTPRSTFPDSTCSWNEAGEEWCTPRPFQHMQVRDSVVVALEVPINFQAPDSLSADTVWSRFVLPRVLRFFGPPDSSRTEDGYRAMWWNWDGAHGPRRSRVVGGPQPDSGSTKIATVFHLECAPGAALSDCTTWGPF